MCNFFLNAFREQRQKYASITEGKERLENTAVVPNSALITNYTSLMHFFYCFDCSKYNLFQLILQDVRYERAKPDRFKEC